MSSRNRVVQPSLLILSRAIYAKRSDDVFHPGTIESKQADDSYLVKFTDGASERIEEPDITWLGFWGLPPWCWPRNPIVQTAGPANMNFINGLSQNDNRKGHVADSVPSNALFREGNGLGKRVNGFSERDVEYDSPLHSQKMNGLAEELSTFEQISAHEAPKQSSENHRRISVLRMCCTEANVNREHSKTDQLELSALKLSPHSTSPNDEDKKHFTFDEVCKTLKAKNDTPVRKRKISTNEYEVCSIKEKYSRSEDIENELENSLSYQKHYPAPLSPLLSPHYQSYGHQFGISVYDAPSPPIPASFRLQTRTRRRSENKKCRKVYGIENRDIWCTQCKWKKACTRFTGNDKNDRPGLMYITDYEGLQYPV